MNIQTFYTEIGADAKGVLNRLGSEALILKYLRKFRDDNSFRVLCDSFNNGRYEEAFRAAHTMKGICLNLDILPLSELSQELTELLRNYTPDLEDRVRSAIDNAEGVYNTVANKIEQLT